MMITNIMMISKCKRKFDFNSNNFIFLSFFFSLKVFIEYIYDYRIIGDAAGGYNFFQYFYNFWNKYRTFPQWVDFMDGGFPSILLFRLENGILQYSIIIITSFLKNPLLSYYILIYVYYLIFSIGLYKNIILGNYFNNKQLVYKLLILLYLFTTDFLYQSIQFNTCCFIIIFYYFRKFFHSFKFIELIRIYLLTSAIVFFNPHYFTIINLVYVPILIFLLFYFFKILIKKKITIYFKKKYILYLVIVLILYFIFFQIILYEKSLYFFASTGRDENNLVNFNDFLNRRAGNLNLFLGSLLYQEFFYNLYPVSLGPISVIILIYFFIYKKDFYKNDCFKLIILSLIIIFFISFASNFYLFSKSFMKFFFELPFVNLSRNLVQTLYIFKPVYLILLGLSLDFFLMEKVNEGSFKKNIKFLIICLLIYTEILFSINRNSVDPFMWAFSMLGILIFFILIEIRRINKIKNFTIGCFLLPLLIFYLANFYSPSFKFTKSLYYKNIKSIDRIYHDTNLYEDDKCFAIKNIKEEYSFILPARLSSNQFFLNTSQRPCSIWGLLRFRGSKKPHNHESEKDYQIKISQNPKDVIYYQAPDETKNNFNTKIYQNNNIYYVSNFYLDGANVKKIGPHEYFFANKFVEQNTTTKISYSKNWKAFNDKKQSLNTTNTNGYLTIINVNSKNFTIIYDNSLIKNINYLNTILSFLFIILLLKEIFFIKKLKLKINKLFLII